VVLQALHQLVECHGQDALSHAAHHVLQASRPVPLQALFFPSWKCDVSKTEEHATGDVAEDGPRYALLQAEVPPRIKYHRYSSLEESHDGLVRQLLKPPLLGCEHTPGLQGFQESMVPPSQQALDREASETRRLDPQNQWFMQTSV